MFEIVVQKENNIKKKNRCILRIVPIIEKLDAK